MEIVIDIPEEMYKEYVSVNLGRGNGKTIVDNLLKAIKNGKSLPKHHGRLIDANAYRKELWIEIPNLDYDGSLEPYEEGIYSAIMSLDDSPTIIEADKESEVEE